MFRRLALLLVTALVFLPTHQDTHNNNQEPFWYCPGAISVPLNLGFADPVGVTPGTTVPLEVTLTSDTDLTNFQINIIEDGPIQQVGAVNLPGALAQGEEYVLSIPVQYVNTGKSTLTVTLSAEDPYSGMVHEKSGQYMAELTEDEFTGAVGSFVHVELKKLEQFTAKGLFTAEELAARTEEVLTMDGTWDRTPKGPGPSYGLANPEVSLTGFQGEETPIQHNSKIAASPAGTITVQGNISWQDENGVVHPAFGMTVQVRDDETIGSELVAFDATDVNGDYHFVVDNDDGILQGNRDIFVRILTANTAISIEPAGILQDPYQAESGVDDEVPDNTVITWNFTCSNADPGPACGLLTGGSWCAVYAATLNGGSLLSQIEVEWPGSNASANYDGSDINMRPGDRWDWDVLFHEYGHYVQDVFNINNSPGGPHNIGDCISDVQNSKSKGVRLAWSEGWATYFGTVAQVKQNLAALGVPRVGDNVYADTGESNFSYSLEAQDNLGLGEDNEIAVQRIFWDLWDNASDGRDLFSVDDINLFNIINAADPTTLSAAWGAIRATLNNGQDMGYGAITTDHQVGPSLNSPTPGAIVSPSNNGFSWNRDVGCSSTYDGDGFSLVFYNANTLATVLTIGGINTPSYNLSNGQIQTLVAASHDIIWGVEGSNSDSPASGPYLGETFQIVVNRPPVADAGPDQPNVECASHTTTDVQLDGTGSSDPDGDNLTYSWSAPGVVFNNPNSATPTGAFPKGTTVVTLTVSDGIEEDQDTVSITVVDTTPPDIVCPADITVECTEHGGTSKNDIQLVPFFAGVSATDICDATPTITDDAPNLFPLGNTVVTFTATDDDGNQSTCEATVTVEDTTPPEIEVTFADGTPDVLWPPNHKMATIETEVEVTDVCDPNPTFVLTSITSDEPDNDIGDGNTNNDIKEAAYGTPDLEFKLRAERQGGMDGRKYTIIYTASDISGNTANDTVCVIVPHDQSGNALAANGFSNDGMTVPTYGTFQLVLPAGYGLDPTVVDVDRTYVGNMYGVVRPSAGTLVDVTKDGAPDLILTYDAAALADLGFKAKGKLTQGLHYSTPQGEFLVPDIFALGTPLKIKIDKGGELPDVQGQELSEQPAEIALGSEAPEKGMLHLAAGGSVKVEVFDVQGRLVRTIVNREMAPGLHNIAWDNKDNTGAPVSSGIYFYRILTPDLRQVQKILVTR